jgi:mono/diheme cytochrome c family protein
MKRAGLILLALAVVAVAFGIAIVRHDPQPEPGAALLQRTPDLTNGAYAARLGDCVACHTAPGHSSMTGGLPFPTPAGIIYSTNITPDNDTGIGSYSLKDFIRVMRFGIAPHDRRLYPAMPYTAYAKANDEDLQDLFAYLQAQQPVRQDNKTSSMAWPMNMRWPLAFWNFAFHDTRRFEPVPAQSAEWNRGAYIVQGFGHCGTCHTPRGPFFEEKDVAGKTGAFLSGSSLEGSSPVNLRNLSGTGLAGWSVEDLVEILKTGRNAVAAVNGPMKEVVEHSSQFFADADARAVAVYLKSLQPDRNDAGTFAASGDTYKTYTSGQANDIGARFYMDSCAACHRLDGQGYNHTFPRLAGNPSVLAESPDSLVAIILNGNRLPSTAEAPSPLAMPSFGWRYSDQEVAALATFLRSAWGNHAASIKPEDVTVLRKSPVSDK